MLWNDDEKKDDCVFLSLDTRENKYRLLLMYKSSQQTRGSYYLPSEAHGISNRITTLF